MTISVAEVVAAGGVAAAVAYVLVRYWLILLKAGIAVVIFLAVLGVVVVAQAISGPGAQDQAPGRGAAVPACSTP